MCQAVPEIMDLKKEAMERPTVNVYIAMGWAMEIGKWKKYAKTYRNMGKS